MKIIHYFGSTLEADGRSVGDPAQLARNTSEMTRQVKSIARSRWSPDVYKQFIDEGVDRLAGQLPAILYGTRGDLVGKTVLDLGCGSVYHHEFMYLGEQHAERLHPQFHPWLCRTLYELEANPIGVDVTRQGEEKFVHHRRNLLRPNSLQVIDDESLDIAIMFSLADSPTLNRLNTGAVDLLAHLQPQLERKLKPDGIFFIEKENLVW